MFLFVFTVQWFGMQAHIFSHALPCAPSLPIIDTASNRGEATTFSTSELGSDHTSDETVNPGEECPLCVSASTLHHAFAPNAPLIPDALLSSARPFDIRVFAANGPPLLLNASRAPPSVHASSKIVS